MIACPSCGEENSERARFCSACGAALSGQESREVRKIVTILFSDIVGSTALGERLDPEALRAVMGRYFERMSEVIRAHGGTVEKFIGDAIMAVFGVPAVHEDDALRAVRAAAEMQAALRELNNELERDWGASLQARTGLATGEVVTGTGDQRIATGDAVNTAARLEQHAAPGEVLVGGSTFVLVRGAISAEPVEAIAAKGKTEAVEAYRLVAIARDAVAAPRRESPLVGRHHELQIAVEAFERAQRDRTCQLVTIFGSAGVGKSRLTNEVLVRVEDRALGCRGRCLPYGRGITYWPLFEMVRDLAGLVDGEPAEAARRKLAHLLEPDPEAERIADRILGLLGLSDAATSGDEGAWAVRRLFESVAATRPLIAVFDDIHWAEPALLDLIEYLAEWAEDAPVLLICLARPELLESRPAWGGGRVNAAAIRLEPLREEESQTLIDQLLGGADAPPELRARIREMAGGTPLFLEEMVNMLADEGALAAGQGEAEIRVPPTIAAVLAARIDRLSPGERRVIEAASIVGKEFDADSVAALLAGGGEAAAREALPVLVRKDLVRPERGAAGAYRFRHILIRNAVYSGVSKGDRRRMHEAFAGWLDSRPGEYGDIAGYHLEQAYEAQASLGPLDEGARALGRQAAEHLAPAGRRALRRGDVHAGRDLLARARRLAGDDPPAQLLLDRARAEREFDLGLAATFFDEAAAAAARQGERGLEWRARVAAASVRAYMAAGGEAVPTALAVCAEAGPVFAELGDDEGAAGVYALTADCHNSLGHQTAMLLAAEHAREFAARAGDEATEAYAGILMTSALTYGPTPVPAYIARAEQMLGESVGKPRVHIVAVRALAQATGMSGDLERARELMAEAAAYAHGIGLPQLGRRGFTEGMVEMLAGNNELAEEILRTACEALERGREYGLLSTLVCVWGDALLNLGQVAEAERCAAEGERLGTPDDLATQVYWRRLRGRVRAHQGRFDEARDYGRDAVRLADTTEGLTWQAEALRDLSQVLEMAGDPEAPEVAREALARFRRKGIVLSIVQMEKVVARLG